MGETSLCHNRCGNKPSGVVNLVFVPSLFSHFFLIAPPFTSSMALILSLICLFFIYPVHSSHLHVRIDEASAWNGHLDDATVDSYSQSHFTPYYVPTGSISLDDADPLIKYGPDGAWATASHPALVEHTMHTTSQAGARVDFVFVGIGQFFRLQQ